MTSSWFHHDNSQIAKTVGSPLVRHRTDTPHRIDIWTPIRWSSLSGLLVFSDRLLSAPYKLHLNKCTLLWLGYSRLYPYPSGLLHWQYGHTIASIPAREAWMDWVNASCELDVDYCLVWHVRSFVVPFVTNNITTPTISGFHISTWNLKMLTIVLDQVWGTTLSLKLFGYSVYCISDIGLNGGLMHSPTKQTTIFEMARPCLAIFARLMEFWKLPEIALEVWPLFFSENFSYRPERWVMHSTMEQTTIDEMDILSQYLRTDIG